MVRCDIKVYTHNHFFCRWQPGSWLPSFASPKEGNPRKVDPGLPRLRRTLDIHKQAGLRNSHDPLRVHVLKQCSPKFTACLLLSSAAHRGCTQAATSYNTLPSRNAQ